MSEARIAALVCEGQTDVPILREIIFKLWPEIEDVRSLQPELDETGRQTNQGGWSEVQRWCQQNANALEEVLDPDVGDPIELLLVAIDLDIAVEAGIADPPQAVGLYETTRLRDTIQSWLQSPNRAALPPQVVLLTPVMAIEAWVIAALYPKEKAPEKLLDPAEFLVGKKKLRPSPRDGKPWKELHHYRAFASQVAGKLKQIRKACPEAERSCREIERRRDELEM